MNRDSETRNSAPQAVRFQDAQATYNQGQLKTRSDAAVITEMAVSTFKHRMTGRRSAEDYGKSRWLLTAEEESILLWRCDILQHSGWLQTPEDVGGNVNNNLDNLNEDSEEGGLDLDV